MSIKKIDLRTLNEWVEGLIGKQKIIGAQANGHRFATPKVISAATEGNRLDI